MYSDFFLILLLVWLVDAQGPDPWGRYNLMKTHDNDIELRNNKDDVNYDVFYKRFLQLLIHRGRFKENGDSIVEGYLHFEFSADEFSKLKEYSSLSVSFTSKELREIDGLLSDNVIIPSKIFILAESLFDSLSRLMKAYYIQLLIGVALCGCIYCLQFVNFRYLLIWRNFINVLIVIYICICIYWECMLEIEIYNKKLYQKLTHRPWWALWDSDNDINIVDIRNTFETLQPTKIVGNVISKTIFSPMKILINIFDEYADMISQKFPFGTQTPAYGFLTVFYSVILIYIVVSLFVYLIFGITYTFNFMGFEAKISGSDNKNKNGTSSNTSSDNAIKDANLRTLVKANYKLVEKLTQSSTSNRKKSNSKKPPLESIEYISDECLSDECLSDEAFSDAECNTAKDLDVKLRKRKTKTPEESTS